MFLGNALCNTGQYLIVQGHEEKKLYFPDKLIDGYKDIIHLDGAIFIVQNQNGKFGLIKLELFRPQTIRAIEYHKIELAPDKDTILLYKNEHNRPRFISLHSIMGDTIK